MESIEKNKYGLSRKTNVIIAGAGSIALAKDSWYAVVAILTAILLGITYQFILDYQRGQNEKNL